MSRSATTDAPSGWFVAAVGILALVIPVELLDAESSLAVSCVMAPFLASATCSPGRTAVVSVLSVLVAVWLFTVEPAPSLSAEAVRIAVVLFAAVLAPVLARQRRQGEDRMRNLSNVARIAQMAVLTPVPPVAGRLRLASAYESAAQDALIGGDLFGVVETDGRVRLVVGDVRGKGLDAVNTAALTLASFREAAHHANELESVGDHCDAQLRTRLSAEDFVTAVLADVSDAGHVRLVGYGHPAPVLVRRSEVTLLEFTAPSGPLGLAIPTDPPVPLTLDLEPGDRLLFFTDGLLETRDRDGRFLDLASLAAPLGLSEFDRALPELLRRLHAKARAVEDDLALLLLEYDGISGGDAEATDLSAARETDGPDRLPPAQRTRRDPNFGEIIANTGRPAVGSHTMGVS